MKAESISDFLQQWLESDYLEGPERDIFKRYYASYVNHFGSYIKFHYGQQTKELFDSLGRDTSKRVLEVGCGCGTESLWLALQGFGVKGIDISDDLLNVGRARQEILETLLRRRLPCEFKKRSLLDIQDEQYDVIWMELAFHHLEPRAQIVKKLSSCLRPGGKLVISEINGWNPAVQGYLFKLRGFRTVIEAHGTQWGNERIITARALCRLLEQHGIQKERVRYFRFFPNKRWADWIASRVGVIDSRDVAFLRPLYTHYNYVGVKG